MEDERDDNEDEITSASSSADSVSTKTENTSHADIVKQPVCGCSPHGGLSSYLLKPLYKLLHNVMQCNSCKCEQMTVRETESQSESRSRFPRQGDAHFKKSKQLVGRARMTTDEEQVL